MSFLYNLRVVPICHLLQKVSTITSSPANVQCVHQFQTASTVFNKTAVVTNLCEKFCCAENVAKQIYDKFPSLRSLDAIKQDSLHLLREKVPLQSIVENPVLVTINISDLQPKIDLLYTLEPRNLEDFLPLLTLKENALISLVHRLKKEEFEIKKGNRIYYLSETLQVEPKVISQYRANCGYELFFSSFQSFKRRLDVLLDYGVSRNSIAKSLYVLRYSENFLISRSERMHSIGLPIKMRYYQISDEDFNAFIYKNSKAIDRRKPDSTLKSQKKNKRDLKKAIVVEKIKSLLDCDDVELSEIYYNHVSEVRDLTNVETNIQYLLKVPVNRDAIIKNGFLLSMPLQDIKVKMKILMEMQPKNVEDFIPLVSADATELDQYKSTLECHNVLGVNHPIYYFSEQLKIPAPEVATHFVEKKEIFFEFSPKELIEKLIILMKYNVVPSSILNCKVTFKKSVAQIEKNICKLQANGVENVSSWMIFSFGYPDHEKIISDYMREKMILEGFSSSKEYLAHRLGWTEYNVKMLTHKYPSLSRCSAIKIKNHLDFYLNEAKFTAQEITAAPYILTKNIEEIKIRHKELIEIGAPITLPVLYHTTDRYLKYVRQHCSTNEMDQNSSINLMDIENRLINKKVK